MKTLLSMFSWMAVIIMSGVASHAIVVDGTRDAQYGAALAVQTVQTQFGDADPANGNLGGSELDAAYAAIEGGRLFLMLTGNHEPNFNKLSIFIDSKAGGQNTMTGLAQYDFFDEGSQQWISERFGEMRFDEGFTADYNLFSRWGGSPNPPYEVDFVDLGDGSATDVLNSGANSPDMVDNRAIGVVPAGAAGADRPNSAGSALSQELDFAIDNNNSAGVSGGTEAADQAAAMAVSTGMEFSIALADLGNPAPGESIKMIAIIGNGNYDYLSNQLLAGLPAPQGNLGGDGAGGFTGTLAGIDLTTFAGDQFFSIVVPESNPLTCDLNGDGNVDAADAGIMFGVWGDLNGVANAADKNGDGFVDALDAGVMFEQWTGDLAPADSESASAEYDPATGNLRMNVNGAVNVFVNGASGLITPLAEDPAGVVGLLTNNKNRVGMTNLSPISVSDFSFGSIGGGIPMEDLTLVYSPRLGGAQVTVPFSGVAGAQAHYVPEPASLGMIVLGLAGLLAARRR